MAAAGGQTTTRLSTARPGLYCPGGLRRPGIRPCLVTCDAALSGRPTQQQLQRLAHFPQQQQPQQLRGSAGAPQDTPAAVLTRFITDCRTVAQLEGVAQRHKHQLNPIHVGALLSKLAKLATQQGMEVESNSRGQRLLAQLVPLFSSQLQQMGPRVLANSVWALAKLGHVPDQLLVNRMWLSLVPAIPHMLPQQLSSLLWALAAWHKQLQAQQGVFAAWEWQVVGAFPVSPPPSPPPAAAAAAAAAAAGYGSQQGGAAATLGLHQLQQREVVQAYAEPPAESQPAFERSGEAGAPGADPRPSSSSSSSGSSTQGQLHLLRLGLTPGRLQLLEEASGSCLHTFTPQGLSNTLYAWAVLGVVPSPAWCDLYWRVSAAALHHFEPQHLSNTVWAAAKLQLQAPPDWAGRWWVASQQALTRCTPQGCSNMLWAVAVQGWAVPLGWAESFARVTQPRLAQWPEQALTNCCWAWGTLARQDDSTSVSGSRGGRGSMFHHAQQQQQQQQQGMSRQQLLALLEDTGWAAAALGASYHGLRRWTCTQQLANTLWGFSALGLLPPPLWLDTFFTATAPRLKGCLPEELSHLLVACARLQVQPGEAWMAVWEAAAAKALPLIHGYNLANIAWSLVQMGHVPGQAFQQQYLREVVVQLRSSCDAPGGGRAPPAGTYASASGTQQQQQQHQGGVQPQTSLRGGALETFSTPSSSASAAGATAHRGGATTGADAVVTGPMTGAAQQVAWGMPQASSSSGSAGDSKWHLNSRGISVLAWAFARQGWLLPPKLWLLLQQAALQQLGSCTLHGGVLLLWALSSAQQPVMQELVDGVMEGAARRVQQLQQELQAARAVSQQPQRQQQQQPQLEEVGADVQAAGSPSYSHLEQQRVQVLNDVVLLLWASAQLGAAPAAEPLLLVVAWAQSQLCVLLYRCHSATWLAAQAQGSPGVSRAAAAQAVAARVGMSLPLVRKQRRQQQLVASLANEDSGIASQAGRYARHMGHGKSAAAVGPAFAAAAAAAAAEGPARQVLLQSPVLAAAARWSVMLLYSLAVIGFHPGTQQLKPWYRWSGPALLLLTPRDLAQLLWSCVALEEVPPRGWLVRWQAAWQHSTQLLPVLAPDLELLREALTLMQQRTAQRQQQRQEQGVSMAEEQAAVESGDNPGHQQGQQPSLDVPLGPTPQRAAAQLAQQQPEETYMPAAEWRQLWGSALTIEQRAGGLELLLQQSLAQSA